MLFIRWITLCTFFVVQAHLRADIPSICVARYGDKLDWGQIEQTGGQSERYWRTKEEWSLTLEEGVLPLCGLRIALDPGHLGAEWATSEGRNFRMSDDDYWVREGDLVLEVALRIRRELEQLGGEVFLLRDSSEPVNPRSPQDYLPDLLDLHPQPDLGSVAEQADYALMLQRLAVRQAIVSGELAARASRINTEIHPDLAISLHINAVPWQMSESGQRHLSNQHHLHVLVFGAMSLQEAGSSKQRQQLATKVSNGSGTEELALGDALAMSLAAATGLPAAVYQTDNAVLCDPQQPYLWARNLYMLRSVECPIVMLEPYVANSRVGYARIQAALDRRAKGLEPEEDDILVEYADAVVAGIVSRYAADSN